MAITDIIAFLLSIGFMVHGANRGFMNSLIPPVSIVIASIFSIIYYQKTQDITASLVIGLAGPILLTLFLKFILKTWAQSDVKTSSLSRLGGAIMTLVWGWVFIAFALILLTVLPPWGKIFSAVQNDVSRSLSYSIATGLKQTFFTPQENTPAVTNENAVSDAKSLAQDPRFQKILQDPEIQKEIDAHDIVKLMRDPKMMTLVQQIMNDPAAMKKIMAISRNQALQPAKNP